MLAILSAARAERLAGYFAFSVTSVSRGSVADNGLYVAYAPETVAPDC